jgi:CHASE2 domain-containing sensor protein
VSTVLIASSEYLNALKDRSDLGQTQAFSDVDALRALDVITQQRPSVIALERLFAATSRGAALINRIKADPGLTSCEIRIVTHEVTHEGPSTQVAAAPLPVPTPAVRLDQGGTRRATRAPAGIEVLVDGNPASLVDVSVNGAQVVSSTILRPNQRLRVTLPDPAQPLRLSAAVAWASFEMPKGGPRYRAGLAFLDADAAAVGHWIERLTST